MNRNHEETSNQIQFVKWFYLQYPKLKIIHIPNEGKRTPRGGAVLKKMGLLPGVPDLFIPAIRKGKGGMFIEMKSSKGIATKSQIEFLKWANDNDYCAIVCNRAEAAITATKAYLN